MKYRLSKLIKETIANIGIKEAEYLQIKQARDNLFEALFLEENLDIVIENYYEYEVELLAMATRMMLGNNMDFFSTNRDRILICRRISNLMSACRMYQDQIMHHISNIYGNTSDIFNQIDNEERNYHNNNFEYQVMEELRNYAQHRDLPLQNVMYSLQTVEQEGTSKFLYTVIPFINILMLKEDKKIKRKVIDKLLLITGKYGVDIRPIMRDYIECIGYIHEKVRELITPNILEWEKLIYNTINRFPNEIFMNDTSGNISLIIEKDDGSIFERIDIFDEFIVKRRELEMKNRFLENLKKCYVSNEIRD